MQAAMALFQGSPVLGERLLARPAKAFRSRLSSFSSACSRSPSTECIELEQTQISLQGRDLVIVQPKDVDQVLDMYIEQGRSDSDPYWCRLWPSAIVLAEEILKNPQLVTRLHVCDLGCGLGLAGLAALLAGAKEVVLYDQEPLALICAFLSVQANFPHVVAKFPCAIGPNSYGKSVNYGENLAPDVWKHGLLLSSFPENHSLINWRAELPGSIQRASAEVFDWSQIGTQMRKYDLVLACDILYEKKSVPFLASVLPKLVLQGSGRVVMADPTHRTPRNRQHLLELLSNPSSNEGLKLQKHERREKRTTTEKGDYVEVMHFMF